MRKLLPLPALAAAALLATPGGALAAACPAPRADHVKTWEVVFATMHSRARASALAKQIVKGGLHVVVESEGCGNYQVATAGFASQHAAATLAAQIRKHGEKVTLERG